jgi:hypothetical protein
MQNLMIALKVLGIIALFAMPYMGVFFPKLVLVLVPLFFGMCIWGLYDTFFKYTRVGNVVRWLNTL